MSKERYTQVIGSVVIAAVLFTAGFYTGKKETLNNVPAEFLNATSTESIDMAPFWEAWNLLDEKFASQSSTTPKVGSQDKIWGAIQGLAASFGDPYTVFFPPV
jgi:hypothetical protein